jgi:hypothetical protein
VRRGWNIPRVDHVKVKGNCPLRSHAGKEVPTWYTKIDTHQAVTEVASSFKDGKIVDSTSVDMLNLLIKDSSDWGRVRST